MSVKDFGCLLIDNNRSKAYIQKLSRAGLAPDYVIYVKFDPATPSLSEDFTSETKHLIDRSFKERKYFLYDPKFNSTSVSRQVGNIPVKYASFDPQTKVMETLIQYGITCEILTTDNINDAKVIEAFKDSGPKFFLFGGGGILRKGFFHSDKQIIHIHPGLIPSFKGSHCIEWSALLQGKCYATAFFMTEIIDTGTVISCREFELPSLENGNIAPLYSSHIRSELALDIVEEFFSTGQFGQESEIEGSRQVTYHKMHPAITNIVFHRLLRG